MKNLQLNSAAISILVKFYHRPRFEKWIRLEALRSKIIEAVETDTFTLHITRYVSTALSIPEWVLGYIFWMNIVLLFYALVSKNSATNKIPLLEPSAPSKRDDAGLSWDYDGRSYYVWLHLLANKYGWTIQYINRLDVDIVLALIQEILTEQQLEKEFQWSMTEVSYKYDKATKQSSHVPLTRPYWMLPKAKEIKIIKIPKLYMPVGNIVDISNMQEALEKQKSDRTKET